MDKILTPSAEQVREWAEKTGARFDPHWGISYNVGTATFERFAELAAQWGAEQVIKGHVLLNTLESAKQQMQEGEPHSLTMHIVRKGDSMLVHATSLTKVAGQAPVKEPKLPKGDAVSCKCSVCEEWQQSTESGMVCKNGHGGVLGVNVRTYTATQMHDHFQAGVRAGMAQQSQDAKRYRYAMDWRVNNFAVCMRMDAEPWWDPIKTSGPLDAAMQGDQK